MIRWRYLIVLGFIMFLFVTQYVAKLGLTDETFRLLTYATIGGYGLGMVGMGIALAKASSVGKVIIGVIFGLGTGAVTVFMILPRIDIRVVIPF